MRDRKGKKEVVELKKDSDGELNKKTEKERKVEKQLSRIFQRKESECV